MTVRGGHGWPGARREVSLSARNLAKSRENKLRQIFFGKKLFEISPAVAAQLPEAPGGRKCLISGECWTLVLTSHIGSVSFNYIANTSQGTCFDVSD